MLEAILERLKEKSTLTLDELVVIIYDDFGKPVTKQSLSRTLASIGWSNKAARQRARNKTRICEIISYIDYPLIRHTSWFMWMSRAVTRGLGFGELAGLLLV
jgi:hypothetical protein